MCGRLVGWVGLGWWGVSEAGCRQQSRVYLKRSGVRGRGSDPGGLLRLC
jgi:hypothetical protein